MKNMRLFTLLLCGTIPIIMFGSPQLKGSAQDRSISAFRLNGTPIEVDGRLDDPVWQELPRQGDFLQRNPDDGSKATQRTEFAVAYNSEFLYVGIRAFDDQPELIDGILTRRDESSPSDWLYISIDSYHDHRTAFEFGLNAAGVKQDLRRFDDDNADFDWNAVWEGDVNIDDQGWTAEFAIPFRELRFNSAESLNWGLNVYREFPRNDNELAIWNHWSHEETGFVSNYGELSGLTNVEAEQPIYIAPYVLGRSGVNDAQMGEFDQYENSMSFGLDIRKNFDLGLTFTGTINPDFGQV